jgi:rhodanese-related sulfurtransferase
MKRLIVLMVGALLVLTGCRSSSANSGACAAPPSEPAATAATTATRITHVAAPEAGRLGADHLVQVVDVRTPEEYAKGHIAGAKLINFTGPDFAGELAGLDRNQPYLVPCAGGGRSAKALATFQQLGFKEVFNLDGGFEAWEKAGLPVVK